MPVYIYESGGLIVEEVTANPSEVLDGYTYNDSDGVIQTGIMNSNGAATCTLAVGDSYTNVAGYYSSISITGPTLSGTATADQVLANATFYSSTGTKVTGTMTNRGAVTSTINIGGSYSGAAGYYTSISVSGPTLSGNADVSQVLSGSTFYSSTGTKKTGTMPNRGALNVILYNMYGNKEYNNTNAGYYSSIKVTASYTVEGASLAIDNTFINTTITAAGSYGISYSMGTTTSVKIFASGGYIWITRNAGSDGTAYITKIW